MFEFLLGFGIGIIVGIKYNCKPYIDFALYSVIDELKDIRNDFKSSK